MPVDGRFVVRVGKVRGGVLVFGQGLVGVCHLHAAHAAALPMAVAVATVAVCKGDRGETQDRNARKNG